MRLHSVKLNLKRFFAISVLFSLLLGSCKSEEDKQKFIPYHPDTSKTSPLRNALGMPRRKGLFSLDDKKINLWCPSIIKLGGKYHLFASAWPNEGDDVMEGWKESYVIRAQSNSLFGKYEYQEDVLKPRGDEDQYFDAHGVHNPKIMKRGDKFILYYLGIPEWKSGFAIADNIKGSWERAAEAKIPTNNPAIWEEDDGTIYLVGKGKRHPESENNHGYEISGKYDTLLEVFRADSIYGPYVRLTDTYESALENGYELEDPTVWKANGLYHLLVTDWEGHASGVNKGIVHYVSEDGNEYKLVSREPVISDQEAIKFLDGSTKKFRRMERPEIVLNENNEVVALITAVLPAHGEETTSSEILIFPVDNYDGSLLSKS